jgi:hypothetical protein
MPGGTNRASERRRESLGPESSPLSAAKSVFGIRLERSDSRLRLRAQGVILPRSVGAWRSLVARFVRDEEVAGSNPVAPTIPALLVPAILRRPNFFARPLCSPPTRPFTPPTRPSTPPTRPSTPPTRPPRLIIASAVVHRSMRCLPACADCHSRGPHQIESPLRLRCGGRDARALRAGRVADDGGLASVTPMPRPEHGRCSPRRSASGWRCRTQRLLRHS